MPSAARQRLPADLWRMGHRKHTSGSPGPFYYSHEIQASPGQCDVFQEDRQDNRLGSRKHLNKSPRKQGNGQGWGSPKSVHGRESASRLSMASSDSESGTSSGRKETVELSSSAKSDSCLSYNPSIVCDAYAMESSVAPHPSEVPFPPLEWLQSSSKQALTPVVSDLALTAVLGCHVAA